ncbi:hypothetical protein ILUMI_27251 [Ignelater luminosus]|uniref:Uncharacterized protein n=1 Tax=Ignelater luminosus TaxID=2038154 RepID=A0A8K0C588_IGNLU|nr:hypothetical protein ILUMI_27251 [Ignelater luminosus]
MTAVISNNVRSFDGANYSNWEFGVNLLLKQASVLKVTKTEPPADVAQKVTFEQNDVKARNTIVQCLADNILEVVKLKKTAKEIIEALLGTNTKKGIAMQVELQRQQCGLKYMKDTPLHVFLTNLK